MEFVVEYPVLSTVDGGGWLEPANIVRFARMCEEVGVHALSLTDHPAPSAKWLDQGGHETFDPFTALGFIAAVTTQLRLMTRLIVLPYRNPLLTAKSFASLDVLSGGRATFVVGVGYLRSEFAALGVDFEDRNDLFDEALTVLTRVWDPEPFVFEGLHFRAVGQDCRPAPVQKPHPPIWIGGNSRAARERVARHGQGWAPMPGGAATAGATRTAAIETVDDLARAIEDLGHRLEAVGRRPDDVAILAGLDATDLRRLVSPDQRSDEIGQLEAIGVTHSMVRVPTDSPEHALDSLAALRDLATEVLPG